MIAEADSQNFCEQSSVSSAVSPPFLTPIGRSTEIHRAACFTNPSFSLVINLERVASATQAHQHSDGVIEPTAKIAPTATQPIPTSRIHNRSARLPHSHCRDRTRRKPRRRPIRRAVAEAHLARLGAAVEVLALNVVLGTAVPIGTAAAVIVSQQTRIGGGDAGAGT